MSELAKTTQEFLDTHPELATTRMRRMSKMPRTSESHPVSTVEVRACNVLRVGCDEDAALRYDLERVALFDGLPGYLIDQIVTMRPVRRLSAGQALLLAGEDNDRMFVVLSGELSVHLDDASAPPIAYLHAGDSVGELSVLDRSPVSATVIAHTACSLVAIDESLFWRISHASHGFAVSLMRKLADRLRANNGTVQANMAMCAKLEEVAAHDALTNVHSRRWLDAVLPGLCDRHRRGEMALSLALIDIDHFKAVNDAHGHQTGDHVLSVIAKALRTHLRPDDFVARYGGEEFVVLLPHTFGDDARSTAERLRKAIGSCVMRDRNDAVIDKVTVSIGLAELGHTDDAAKLMARADDALYRAKRNGRDRVEG